MSYSPGYVAYKLSFELSPIILTGGLATNIPGGALPIIAITESLNFIGGILGGSTALDLNDFFAHFHPLPGSTLIDQSIAKYPYATQDVAANAAIRNPLTISMRMMCPAREEAGYALKLATMSALQGALAYHNSLGGTYTIATPSYFYTNCVMLRMTDASSGDSKQPQNAYQLDFERPLLTLQDAQSSQNSLMSKLTSGTQISGQPTWSGLAASVGVPSSLTSIGTLSSATNPAGALTQTPTIGAL